MHLEMLRRQFPVFERYAYLSAGTCGPLPAQALRAGADVALVAAEEGRGMAYYTQLLEIQERLRARYAAALGAAPVDVALTLSTSDGIARVLNSLNLQPGDEVLTAPDEHPGVLGPLAQLARVRGITVRTAPLADIADAVTASTTAVVCSHVSWLDGALAPTALADVGKEIPVILDGAQGVGAVPIDVESLGCAAYAGSGQKWMCGPVGTGSLWVAPQWRERIPPTTPGYANLEVAMDGLDAVPAAGGKAYDASSFPAQTLAAAEAAAALLEDVGWDAVWEGAAAGADRLTEALRAAGRVVQRPSRTTLVAFEDPTPEDTVARLAEAGVTLRFIPGTPLVRASVGAWNDGSDAERLLAAL